VRKKSQDNSNDPEIIDKVNSAIEKANLSKFVGNLPDGINTIVGEKGMRISGGQKQRLIFARAFFHNRTIFILDESTSSLDSETEKQLMHEINKIKGKVTLIIIAHRMTTVKLCDKIYRLSEGKIINSGTYEEVIKDHD